MLYEVKVINSDNAMILDELGLFQNEQDAAIYMNLHKYEVAENEKMVVVERSIDSLGNIPSVVYIKFQTFTNSQGTSTTLERVETFIQGIQLPGNLLLEEGKAAIFKDDEYIEESYTIYYPILSKDLLENSYSKSTLCFVAEQLVKKFKSSKICLIDNFNIENYI